MEGDFSKLSLAVAPVARNETLEKLLFEYEACRLILQRCALQPDDHLLEFHLPGEAEQIMVAMNELLVTYGILTAPVKGDPFSAFALTTERTLTMIDKTAAYWRGLNLVLISEEWLIHNNEDYERFIRVLLNAGIPAVHYANYVFEECAGVSIRSSDHSARFNDFADHYYYNKELDVGSPARLTVLKWIGDYSRTPLNDWNELADKYAFYWNSMTSLLGVLGQVEEDRAYFFLLITLLVDNSTEDNNSTALTVVTDKPFRFPSRWPKGGVTSIKPITAFITKTIKLLDTIENYVSELSPLMRTISGGNGQLKELFYSELSYYTVCKMFLYVKRHVFEGIHGSFLVGLFDTFRDPLQYGDRDVEQEFIDPEFVNSTKSDLAMFNDMAKLSVGNILDFFLMTTSRQVRGLKLKVRPQAWSLMLLPRDQWIDSKVSVAIGDLGVGAFFSLVTLILTLTSPSGVALTPMYVHCHKYAMALYPRIHQSDVASLLMLTSAFKHEKMCAELCTRKESLETRTRPEQLFIQ